jgi:hypothetical protein
LLLWVAFPLIPVTIFRVKTKCVFGAPKVSHYSLHSPKCFTLTQNK